MRMESVDLFVKMSPKGSLFIFCLFICGFDNNENGEGVVVVVVEEEELIGSLTFFGLI